MFPHPPLANTNLWSWLIASQPEWHIIGQRNHRGEYHSVWGPEELFFSQHRTAGASDCRQIYTSPLHSSTQGKDKAKGKVHGSQQSVEGRNRSYFSVSSSYVHSSMCNPSHHSLCHTQCRPHTWFDVHARWSFRGKKMADFI